MQKNNIFCNFSEFSGGLGAHPGGPPGTPRGPPGGPPGAEKPLFLDF